MITSFTDMAAKSTFDLPSQNTSQSDASSSSSSTSTSSTSSTPDAADTISEDFNTFLTLLTAQVQYQDPLEPIDSTQFVEQLATFSSLEQQVKTNDNLESISGLISDLNAMAANEWLGEEVSVKSSWLENPGEATTFTADPAPAGTDETVLQILDSYGNTVATETLKPGATSVTWNGKADNGASLDPNSLLHISVNHYENGDLIAISQPGVVTEVTGVAEQDGKLKLATNAKLIAELGNFEKVD